MEVNYGLSFQTLLIGLLLRLILCQLSLKTVLLLVMLSQGTISSQKLN